jgi:ribonuclease HI
MAIAGILSTDGGSRGNPGIAGIGFRLEQLGEVKAQAGAYIGINTNNVAEYKALIWGLRNAKECGIERLLVRADSELMVKQMNGLYKVKATNLIPLHQEAFNLASSFVECRFMHVPRSQNIEADLMANQAMDAQSAVGAWLVEYEGDSDALL